MSAPPSGPVTIPILHGADLDRTSAFYGRLGFATAGRWPGYLILSHPSGIELHVTHDDAVDRWTNGLSCYVRFPDAAAARELHDAWAAAGVSTPAELRTPWTTDYGLLEFALIDLDGNLVRIGGPIAG
ncbi:MAG: VOC family protein [Chloroflexota bacterium]